MIKISELKKQIEIFNICLQEERFFDAHEAIESIWFKLRKEKSNEVKLLRAYINAAVSFELYKRGRCDASQKVWCNFIKHQALLSIIESKYQPYYALAEGKILEIRENLYKNDNIS